MYMMCINSAASKTVEQIAPAQIFGPIHTLRFGITAGSAMILLAVPNHAAVVACIWVPFIRSDTQNTV